MRMQSAFRAILTSDKGPVMSRAMARFSPFSDYQELYTVEPVHTDTGSLPGTPPSRPGDKNITFG